MALEVNGLAGRLDLSGEHVRDALRGGGADRVLDGRALGAGLENMALSVHTARRGWATGADILNTRPLAALLEPRRS